VIPQDLLRDKNGFSLVSIPFATTNSTTRMRKAFSIRRPNSSAHAPSAPATRLSTASVTEDYSTGDEQSPSEPIQERFLPRVDSHSPPQQPTQLPGMRRAFSIRRQNNSPRTPSTQATRVSATSVAKEKDEQSVSDPIQKDPFYYNAPLIILKVPCSKSLVAISRKALWTCFG